MSKENKKNHDSEYILKMGFVVIGVIVVLAIIVASWIWNLIFDPEHFDVNKWATRAIFNGSISLAMMVLGFIAIGESLKAKETGKYQERRNVFNDLVNDIYDTDKIVYFDPFISWYAERQVHEKRIRYLTKHGMPRMDAEIIIDYASFDDLEKISGLKPGEKPTGKFGEDLVKKDKDGNDVLIPAIRDTLVAYVEEVLSGIITVEVEDASYYLTADKNKKADLTSLERAQATESERIKSLRISFISKIVIGLVYVTLFALLAVDLNQGMGEAEAIWNLILRIGSATLGFIGGGFTGSSNTRFIYKWLGDKMRVLREYNKFLDSGEYKPKTYAETVKERIEVAKKREEDEKKAVVTPELVPEEPKVMPPLLAPAKD